ncbi:MAG: hypothetical protein J6V71_03030 [Clostridia bacterium]|nr:hypothetical protein [Clostridia bacterium]
MKKILTRIFCVMLLVCLAMSVLTGCAEGKWSGRVTLKNSGAVISNGGFIAETENYLYFINGIGGTYSANKMGEPLKGALMVADKNDLSKVELVVPKLMVANDYNAGVFIDGGYAYYGTPSVDKDASGNVANYKMTFMRTKLDGSGDTDEFFTHNEFVSEYRIVKGVGENAGVYVYYYDSINSAIVCYNTATKTSTNVFKTDDTAKESLAKYVFLNNSDIEGVVGFFTATYYEDDYNENAAENPYYSRVAASYNKVYAIMAGSATPELVISGVGEATSSDDTIFDITLIEDKVLYFTKANKGVTKSFVILQDEAVKIADAWVNAKEVVNVDYINKANMFVAPSDNIDDLVVYVSGESKVYKTTLFSKDTQTKQPIIAKDNVNEMLFIRNENGTDFMYYFNSAAELSKISLANPENEIRVSESTVSTTWYNPEVITIGEKDYIFYADDSSYGKSYVKYLDLDAELVEEDTDEDGENDKFYIDVDSIMNIGKMTTQDQADIATAKINAIANVLPEGGIGVDQEADDKYFDEYTKIKAMYDALSKGVKEKVSSAAVDSFANIKKAFEIAEKYKELADIRDIVTAEDEGADAVKTIYDSIKAEIVAFKNSKQRDAVDALIHNELKAHYTRAVEIFEATEED